jgi:hypothetical protein
MKPRTLVSAVERIGGVLMALLLSPATASPQPPPPQPSAPQSNSAADLLRGLEDQVRALSSSLHELHAEMERSHAEAAQLQQELQQTREQVTALRNELEESHIHASTRLAKTGAAARATDQDANWQIDQRVAKMEEEQQVLGAKVEEQHQTKVESASKYRVKLSGMVLLNVFTNRGGLEDVDFPAEARQIQPQQTNTSFGATLRQSLLGLELFGPQVGGARTRADLQADFAGGLPGASNGVTLGVVRLRTGGFRLDWPRTSVVAGQYAPFFSSLSPTSLASVAYPAFADSGNLWTWTPQVQIEHRFILSEASSLSLQGGILDPLTGEPPSDPFYRMASAGEQAGQPAYAARVAWTHGPSDRSLAVGVGGYYERQNWGFDRIVDAWAGTADWRLPLGRWFSLTGEFYRGRAIGGLGAADGRSVLFSGDPTVPQTLVQGLNTTGGWAQLKFTPTQRVEFNAAFGEDLPSSADLTRFAQPLTNTYLDVGIGRNESAFINSIYHLRSNFLLSAEYRRIRTAEINASPSTANHVSLGAAVLF